MRESPGKGTAREYFFMECLRRWFNPVQLTSGHMLTLLGKEGLELPYIDALGIPRSHVHSVERDQGILAEQLTSNVQWRCQITGMELEQFLRTGLYKKHTFRIFRLDVEGSFRKQIDPALAPLMLYCARHDRVGVATHESVNRDVLTLYEGLYSLALFLWISPTLCEQVLATLSRRYGRTSLVPQSAVRMALRDLFWARCHLEHATAAATLIGGMSFAVAATFMHAQRELYQYLQAHWPTRVQLGPLMDIVGCWAEEAVPAYEQSLNQGGLTTFVRDLEILLYKSNTTFQIARYGRYGHDPHIIQSIRQQAEALLCSLIERPLIWINHKGDLHSIDLQEDEFSWSKRVIWPAKDKGPRDYTPREIKLTPTGPSAMQINQMVNAIRMRDGHI